ncbi:MAG: V-type ATP synthase subunit F [Armatimonadota bacterium]|nr:V-type ATP synthase subunit F [Armatimonadota bacterium]MDR7439903.1 V-type ATP synthase subunit F [Armatimonadota bacterium]MDR7562526.1 V-type ATP synthase subunit F [Armatimonadota bacterium]MDR7568221.1 V-type ATP synthase subunit F [Armatimonadota bacterium]MDR7601410.1 V-type ATP synthase subunit F [Armatimonadota bacterium]
MRYRVAVITDSETATGFRLAGAEVFEADTPEGVVGALREVLRGDYGLVAVNEVLLTEAEEEIRRAMRGRDLPVVVPFPAPRAQLESGEEYIARLVKEHIGFYVKLR